MEGERVSRRLLRAMGALAALATSTISIASPFSVTYTGTISASTFPEILNGQTYTVTLVVDNGNSTAVSQTWNVADLKCVIFRMNNAGNVSYAQDAATTNAELVSAFGPPLIQTDASGAMQNDGDVSDPSIAGPAPGTFSFAGFTPANPINWFVNQANPVFIDQSGLPGQREFSDASGGVIIDPADWTNPVPFTGPCAATGGGGGGLAATAVPAMSKWMLLLLAAALGLGSTAILRRRS